MLSVGQKIYLRRVEQKLTQAELARRVNIPQPNLSNIEKGKQDIQVSTLLRIAHALEMEPHLFLLEEAKKEIFTRKEVEALAQAIAHRRKLEGRRGEIVKWFREILPTENQTFPIRQTQQAWLKLHTVLSAKQIEELHKRVQDEERRA